MILIIGARVNRIGKAWVRVEGEPWNLTWLINNILEKSKRYKVPVQISLESRSLEITISIDLFSIAATILIFLISQYIQRRREKLKSKNKSVDWAREQAKGWVIVHAKGNKPIIEKEVNLEEYWEFYLGDAKEKKYHCRIWRNCMSICEKI